MKFIAETGEEKIDVEIVREGRAVTATIDGREYRIDASSPESGVFLLKEGCKVYEATVNSDTGSNFDVQLSGRGYEIKIIDPKRLRGSNSDAGHDSGIIEIKTAMPGKVVRVLKAEGESVEKGEGVIVVEAMKMQNELKSPKEGTISRIMFSEGDTVAAGEILVTIG